MGDTYSLFTYILSMFASAVTGVDDVPNIINLEQIEEVVGRMVDDRVAKAMENIRNFADENWDDGDIHTLVLRTKGSLTLRRIEHVLSDANIPIFVSNDVQSSFSNFKSFTRLSLEE